MSRFDETNSAYRCGYYDAQEDIIHWMNSFDVEEMDIITFRSHIHSFIMSKKPRQQRRII